MTATDEPPKRRGRPPSGGREAIVEAEAFTREHPLRERAWALRMHALYRDGRQAEALSVFQELRALLSEELGLAPCAELRELEVAMLRQDPSLAVPARPAWAPPPQPARAPACRIARASRTGACAASMWNVTLPAPASA